MRKNRKEIPLPSMLELGVLAMVGYSIYAYGYKQQTWEETQSDLMKVPKVYTEAIARAPGILYDTLSQIEPYKEWSQEWIQNKWNQNDNRPS